MKIKLFGILSFLLFFSISSGFVFAEKIKSFDVVLFANETGILKVEEQISYDFESLERHGIIRTIPLISKVGDLYRIISINNIKIQKDNDPEKFEVTKENDGIIFKIGDPDTEITGEYLYKISYNVENGIGSNFETHDEIYWNATGNNWNVPIENASITFKTPENINQLDLICFTGVTGSTQKNCEVLSGKIISKEILYPGMGLTAAAKYPKGTFPPSTLVRQLPKAGSEKIMGFILSNLPLIWLVLNLVLPAGLIFWYQKKKNKKILGKPAVNFDIPKDEKGKRIAPALAGTIDTARLERDDVVATIFDLAIRRYIRLVEVKTAKRLLPDSIKQKIIKLKNDEGKLSPFEKKLFDRLFRDGDEVYADELKKDFYKTYENLEKEAFKELVNKKYFIKNPKLQRSLLFVFGLMAIFTTNLILGLAFIYLSRKLIGRTALGDGLDFKIDGLKLFLKSMNRNYKWQAKNFYTVEQMIPYAMSLGYIERFMEQLKIIKPDYNPTWYHGYSGGLYASYGSFFSSVNSNITTSAPSSSSGFSGGGSSGGGGGGGGGGSW